MAALVLLNQGAPAGPTDATGEALLGCVLPFQGEPCRSHTVEHGTGVCIVPVYLCVACTGSPLSLTPRPLLPPPLLRRAARAGGSDARRYHLQLPGQRLVRAGGGRRGGGGRGAGAGTLFSFCGGWHVEHAGGVRGRFHTVRCGMSNPGRSGGVPGAPKAAWGRQRETFTYGRTNVPPAARCHRGACLATAGIATSGRRLGASSARSLMCAEAARHPIDDWPHCSQFGCALVFIPCTLSARTCFLRGSRPTQRSCGVAWDGWDATAVASISFVIYTLDTCIAALPSAHGSVRLPLTPTPFLTARVASAWVALGCTWLNG